MKIALSFPSFLLLVAAASGASEQQCLGLAPQEGVERYLGAELDYSVSDTICCNNHRAAERRGYLEAPQVDLFGRLDPEAETIFYDSVCGIPLFVAPRGRTFEEFRAESLKHGWPSFRPEELISENVIIHSDGRMESKCLTHLGHNLPTGNVDRYCIDLVCIAGAPVVTGDELFSVVEGLNGAITAEELGNATTYSSSAEEFSGNYNKSARRIGITVAAFVGLVVAIFVYGYVQEKRENRFYETRKRQMAQTTDDKLYTDDGKP